MLLKNCLVNNLVYLSCNNAKTNITKTLPLSCRLELHAICIVQNEGAVKSAPITLTLRVTASATLPDTSDTVY